MVPPLTPGTTSAAPMQKPLANIPNPDFMGRGPAIGAAGARSPVVGFAELMDRIHQNGQVVGIDEGLNSMTEIEHMSGARTVTFQHRRDFLAYALR